MDNLLDIWNLWLRNFVHQEHYNRLPVRYYAGRAFSTAAPQLSNTIQEYAKNADNVATFKTELKQFYSGNIAIDFYA